MQAFGTASAYPTGIAIFRARDRRGQAPAAALGAILSTAIIGLVFGSTATSAGLHTVALIIAAISALLVVASVLTPYTRGRTA